MLRALLAILRRLADWIDPTNRVHSDAPQGSLGPSPLAVVSAMRTTVFTLPYWRNRLRRLVADRNTAVPIVFKPELVLPSAAVRAGRAAPWPEAPVDLWSLDYQWNGRRRTMADFMTDRETDAVVFVKNGRVVFEAYANGYARRTPHHSWSVTKSYVSTLVGNALYLGLIDGLDDPIEKYLPSLASTGWCGTTLRNLLLMQSGVWWDEHTGHPVKNTQFAQWRQLSLDYVTGGRWGRTRNGFLEALPRIEEQATRFKYNSANTQVLSWMLERLHGQPFVVLLEKQLWQPLGAESDAAILTDRVGDPPASMGLYATARDFARLGQLFLDGGVAPDGSRIVTAQWVREATEFSALSRREYGFHWWSNGSVLNGYTASGFCGQVVSVAPAHNMVGVRMAHDFAAPPMKVWPSMEAPVDMGRQEFEAMFAAVAGRLTD